MPDFDIIKAWLSTHHIKPPDEWLQACLEWLQEEHGGSSLRVDQLKQFVYDQWLTSDLCELRSEILPTDISQHSKTVLDIPMCLQVNSMVDVGLSCYSQLLKYNKVENENVRVSAEPQTELPWEPKPSRMLMLSLTDGVTDIKAIECSPIFHLSPVYTPGFKVCLSGVIICRHGILLLHPENIKILGGEADSFLNTHRVHHELERRLTMDQSINERALCQTFSGRILKLGKDSKPKSIYSNSKYRGASSYNSDRIGDMTRTESLTQAPEAFNDIDMMDDDDVFLQTLNSRNIQLNQESDAPRIYNNPDPRSTYDSFSGENNRQVLKPSSCVQRIMPNNSITYLERATTERVCATTTEECTTTEQARISQNQYPTTSTKVDTGVSSVERGAEDIPNFDFTSEEFDVPEIAEIDNRSGDLADVCNRDPFTYLSVVEPLLRIRPELSFKIKAYISTVLGRLDNNEENGWSLPCRLNDGTSTIDVILTDPVLFSLIGFTAQESRDIKRVGSGDRNRLMQLAQAVRRCQQQLIDLSCVMTVRINNHRAQVTHIEPVLQHHVELLKSKR